MDSNNYYSRKAIERQPEAPISKEWDVLNKERDVIPYPDAFDRPHFNEAELLS